MVQSNSPITDWGHDVADTLGFTRTPWITSVSAGMTAPSSSAASRGLLESVHQESYSVRSRSSPKQGSYVRRNPGKKRGNRTQRSSGQGRAEAQPSSAVAVGFFDA